MPATDSARADMLLRCLYPGAAQNGSRAASSALSPEPEAWADIVDKAEKHEVAGLLFRRLKQSGAQAGVPARTWGRLSLAYLAGAGRNARQLRQLGKVLRRLGGYGIPVIVLKGAFLASTVYDEPALRTMGDVDLLVRKADLGRARAVLFDMGGVGQPFEDVELTCKTRHHLSTVNVGHVVFEMHWTICRPTEPFTVETDGLWARARPATIASVEVLALSPEDLLLHLCMHLFGTARLMGLRPLCDIAETISHYGPDLDWDRVVGLAREWRATRHAGLALRLAQDMMSAAVPDAVIRQLVPGGVGRHVLDSARESALSMDNFLTGYRRQMSPFDRFGARSLRDKASISWQRVFLVRDEMAKVYPASLTARSLVPFYALRLRDVVRTYLSGVLGRDRASGQVGLLDWLAGRD